MRFALVFVVFCVLPATQGAQQPESLTAAQSQVGPKYTVAVGAVGSERGSLAVSDTILGRVEDKFQSEGRVSVLRKQIVESHPDAANEQVWLYGREANTDGAAVVMFKRGPTEGQGRVYVWTATPFGPKPDKPTLVEAVDQGNLRAEQVSRIAAVIEQASSRGHEVALELLIYTNPSKSRFTVGNSPSQLTDDKGFGDWIGTKEEGPLILSAFNEPDYEPSTQQIVLKRDPREGIIRETIKFSLHRRSKRKSP